MNTAVKAILYIVLFIASITMVIVGQAHKGLPWLGLMLLGLIGLLFLLYLYNRPYREKKK